MIVLVDTNVLLDVLAKRHPFYPASAKIWELAESGRIAAKISAISFNNTYYVVERLRDSGKAREAVQLLRDEFETVSLTPQIVNQSIDSEISDFEDAIQFFSAIHAAASVLITRNCDDFPKDILGIQTPEEFLAAFDWT